MPEAQDPQALIEKALSGDPASVRVLVDRLAPVISKRVSATLWRRTGRSNAGQEVADMAQEVFLALFQADGKALRSWDPARGMSLDNFVGLLAQHQVISILRNKRTSPWREEPTEMTDLEPLGIPAATPEAITSSRESLRTLVDRLRESLSPRGLELFQRMIVDEEPMEELSARTGLTRDALYQWKSRILRTIRALSAEADVAKGAKGGGGGVAGGDDGRQGPMTLSEKASRLRIVKGAPPT